MKKSVLFQKAMMVLFAFVLIALPLITVRSANAQEVSGPRARFDDFIAKLKKEGVIADTEGETVSYGDYEDEWAQINWYQWITFEQAERFVIGMNMAWSSASQTPNNFISGCGVIFNSGTTSSDYLLASVRMDGLIYFNGARNNRELSYGSYRYGPASTKGSTDFVMVVDHDKAAIYMDGQRVVRKADMQVMGDYVGLCTLSGTNKDYGTRCTYKDIFFYTW